MNDNNILFHVLESKVVSIADSFDDNVPFHKFSRNYRHKEKVIIKAYIKSLEKQENIKQVYRNISIRMKIKVAIILVIAAVLLTGFTIYITHCFGNLKIKEYNNHSYAFAMHIENVPETIESRYEIAYDMSDWNKEIIDNDQFSYLIKYRKNNEGVNFSYIVKSMYQGVRYNTEGTRIENLIIEDKTVVYYISHNEVNCFTWENEDYVFEFDFTTDYETAVEIVKSIKKL